MQHRFPFYYECSECHLKYADKQWAKKCQQWCRVHHSCNLHITTHADKSYKEYHEHPEC